MGCGSSANSVVQAQEPNGEAKVANGNGVANGNTDGHHDGDDLPTVMLPETPIKPKTPIAFEIPVEEFDGNKRPSSPPPHLQRLLQPPAAEISLPEIEEKLAEAEIRRQAGPLYVPSEHRLYIHLTAHKTSPLTNKILQQRAASAQKRTQKLMKSASERIDNELVNTVEQQEPNKHGMNAVTIPPEPGINEDKNIA